MFNFKKRKEAKKAALQDERAQYMSHIRNLVTIFEKQEDPAQRIINLTGVRENIDEALGIEDRKIARQAKKAGALANVTTLSGGTAAAIGVGALVAPPLILVGVGAAVVGSGVAEVRREKNVNAKLNEESNGYFYELQSVQRDIDRLTNLAFAENVKEISESPLYEQIKADPKLATQFADAAARQFVAEKEAAAEAEAEAAQQTAAKAEKPVVAEEPKTPAAKKEKPDFSNIRKFGR